MKKNNFEWTDELVFKYAQYYVRNRHWEVYEPTPKAKKRLEEFKEEVSTNSFEDWIEWLSNNGKQVTIDHEDFKEHYNNLETFEDNLKTFERQIDEEHYSSVVFGVDNNQ